MVVDLKTKKVRQVADDKYQYRTGDGFSYTWSPDGKWFAMEIIGNRHDPYSDIAIVSADGKGEIVNLTNSGYFDSNPRWVIGWKCHLVFQLSVTGCVTMHRGVLCRM